MSFSKAKLKRFNEVPVGDSPSCTMSDRKDQIKKFLKDLKDSTTGKDKDAKTTSTNGAMATTSSSSTTTTATTTPVVSDTESVKSSKSATMRLFRTPSLPHRLRFRHNTGEASTPKKELQKDVLKGKEALQAAQVELKNKNDMIQEYTSQIDELRTQIFQFKTNETKSKQDFDAKLTSKEERINELTVELLKLRENYENTQLEEVKLKTASVQHEIEIKLLLESHEREIAFLTGVNTEMETNKEKLEIENRKIFSEMKCLKNEIEMLTDELSVLKLALQANEDELQDRNLRIEKLSVENQVTLDEIEKTKKQMQEDMLSYAAENQRMLNELDGLKLEKSKMSSDLLKKNDLIQALQEELSDKEIDLDSDRDAIREQFQDEITKLSKKYEQQISTLRELNDMKIKEMESINVLEMAKLKRDHQDQIKQMENRRTDAIEKANELTEEKIRISEIQNEQKIKELEKTLESSLQRERDHWKSEIDKCQKIAEAEIIQGELEKQDLKTLLENAHEMLRERDARIQNFEGQLTNGIDYYVQLSEQLEQQVNDVKQECGRIMTEKYNYQLTLNNTRSTVNILMERLKKSDTDVETLKIDLEATQNSKKELETINGKLEDDLKNLKSELDEYKIALTALRNSSMALEREMKEKESIFEKLMTSEEETLETVNKIGKLFNDRIEENIDKYFEMYVDLKRKYEARETYIKDMKALLDDFATNIELARLELVAKDQKLLLIINENKKIKLENMTLRYRCEQFEIHQKDHFENNPLKTKCDNVDNSADDGLISKQIIENVLAELDCDLDMNCDKLLSTNESDEMKNVKIMDENKKLKETLSEQIRRNNLLQEMIESENSIDTLNLQKMIEEKDKALQEAHNLAREVSEKYDQLKSQTNQKNVDNLKETNANLKNKILQLQTVTKEQENKINELQEKTYTGTPRKAIVAVQGTPRTPRTPKTPKSLFFPGKENLSPSVDTINYGSPKNILKPRN